MKTKKCSKCDIEKVLSEFHKDKAKKDGVRNVCKICVKKISTKYYENNKNKILEDKKNYKPKKKKNKPNLQIEQKKCSKCDIEKTIDNFYKDSTRTDGFSYWCKECAKKKNEKWEKSKQNKKRRKKYVKKWQQSEKGKKWFKQYEQTEKRQKYRQKYEQTEKRQKYKKEYKKSYEKNRRKKDPSYRLRQIISNSINKALKENKTTSCLEYLPYSFEELKEHLEKQFEPWMNWENYGKTNKKKRTWQIDHIIPQSKLPYDSMEHSNFQKCWCLENLRPLEAFENIQKSDKLVEIK